MAHREDQLRRRRTQPPFRKETQTLSFEMVNPEDTLAPVSLFWDNKPKKEEIGVHGPGSSKTGDFSDDDIKQIEIMTRQPIRPYYKPGAQRGMMSARPKRSAVEKILLQFIICVAVFVVAVVIKFAMPEAAQTVSGWVSEGISGTIDYKSAFITIGQTISGGAGFSEVVNVISVELFGGQPENGDTSNQNKERTLTPDGIQTTSQPLTPAEETESVEDSPKDAGETIADLQMSSKLYEAIAREKANITAVAQTKTQPEAQAVLTLDDLSLSLSAEDSHDDTDPLPFGVDKPDKVDFTNVLLAFEYTNPLEGTLTSPFGFRDHPLDGEYKFHYGLDLAAAKGTPIIAFADGEVEYTGESVGGYGKYVRIAHSDGTSTLYGHCDSILVSRGQQVKKGEIIATVGMTGAATGYHLHFEICRNGSLLDPRHYVAYTVET